MKIEHDASRLRVVGIGASTGGVDAFCALLKELPDDAGLAYVFVQHLDPTHASTLSSILAKVTKMPVIEATDGLGLVRNSVYVITPNTDLAVADDLIVLSERAKGRMPHMSIDFCFRSLSENKQQDAIGVLLSGAGSDGTEGLRALQSVGATTFAQDAVTARCADMPVNAANAGVVDQVLTPKKIAEALARLGRASEAPGDMAKASFADNLVDPAALNEVCKLVHEASGMDFSEYKPNTIKRRLARRMALLQVDFLADYIARLQTDAEEASALSRDILIHVTSFFRDPEIFEALARRVIPDLVKRHQDGSMIRVWVPGCSSGEEVYSIAIAFFEALTEIDEAGKAPRLQIFGTDLSADAIARSRAAVYPEASVHGLGSERLAKFFINDDDGYRVVRAIRECCVFVKHDLTRDPPLAKLDLVSCRNILIYFGEALQKKIIPLFHYCLNASGFLLLGRTESASAFNDIFEPVDKISHIFQKQGTSRGVGLALLRGKSRSADYPGVSAMPPRSSPWSEIQRQADSLLLSRYVTPAVLVNSQMEVVHVRGKTGPFLELPAGQPNFSLLRLAREELVSDLRIAFEQAKSQSTSVRRKPVVFSHDGTQAKVAIEVIPLVVSVGAEQFYLVLFEPQPLPAKSEQLLSPQGSSPTEKALRFEQMQQELLTTKDYLQLLLDERQRTNDDLMFTNEELVSTNEELQSTNEEMETAKEELQSTNEELNTVNDELHDGNDALNRANSDLVNLLGSMEIPIVIIGADRCIRRFTPSAKIFMNLIPADIGRAFDDIKFNFIVPDLEQQIADVLESGAQKETEIESADGKWFRMRLRPYHTLDNVIDGVVLSLIDIDRLKRAVTKSEANLEYVKTIVETIKVPLLVLDHEMRVVSSNFAFYNTFGGSAVHLHNRNFFDVRPEWNVARLSEQISTVSSSQLGFDVEASIELGDGVKKLVFVSGSFLDSDTSFPYTLLSISDVTERAALLSAAQKATQTAEKANLTKDHFLATLSHELRTPLSTILLRAAMLQRDGMDLTRASRLGRTIERAAEMQSQLIDDLLDISRIVAGTLRVEYKAVDINEAVSRAIDAMRALADAKSVKLLASASADRRAVMGDAGRVQQVFCNLLSNAIKFSEPGGEVAITSALSNGFVRVCVADQGRGIAPEFIRHVFSRFTQADSSTTRRDGGLGLGLAIVRDLVRLHQGTIEVESSGLGHGATFTVLLPTAVNQVSCSKDIPSTTASAEARSDNPVKDMRVLIVDDDDATREALIDLLRGEGASVCAVASADQAETEAARYHPDVLLCDIAMPGEDGYSFMRRLRAKAATEGGRIPAVALTALASDEDKAMALSSGFQMHLSKPVNRARVCAALVKMHALRGTVTLGA